MPADLTRRSFLVAGASAAVIAACSSNDSGSPSSSTSGATTSSSDAPQLITFTDTSALVPGSPQRFTFGIADQDNVSLSDVPDQLLFDIVHEGESVGSAVAGKKHADGIPRPYYPVEFTPPSAGVYTVVSGLNGTELQLNIQIPDSTTVVGPGQAMIPVDTPTSADQRGVELLCTRNPVCPLHDVTLREALALGQPVALLISTPKYCQIAICGPVLDVLLAQKDQFPQIKMLHAEVYPSDADAQPPNQQLTEAVKAYKLTFEPALYLARADGSIMKRLDTIFDGVELHDALTQLVG